MLLTGTAMVMGAIAMHNRVPGHLRPSAQRVRRLRAAMGFDNVRDFAEYLGVAYGRYHHLEMGMQISRQMAEIIVAKCPGVTLDWLLLGRTTPMPHYLAQSLIDEVNDCGLEGKSRTSAG